jgi:Mce-associated membrane protein
MNMTLTTDTKADSADDKADAVDEKHSDATESDSMNDAADRAGEVAEQDSDDDAAEVAEHDSDTKVAETERTRSLRRPVLVGAVATLLIAALASSAFLGWTLWQQRQVANAGQQAQAAAVAYAQVLTSIESDKVDENFNQVLDGATGEFKDMYSKSSTQLRQLLIDNKANAHGVVVESAIQSESKDKVVVLLFVDQSVSNTNVPDPRIDRSRIKMTMELADGRWRASQVALP